MTQPIDRKTLQAIFKAIRDQFKQSSAYQTCLTKATSSKKGPRGGKRIICAKCENDYLPKDIECDHYPEPVVEFEKYWYEYDTEQYYSRVFTLPIRPLCKSCHKSVTTAQVAVRKASKPPKKSSKKSRNPQ